MKRLQHISVGACAIHFWWNGLAASEMLSGMGNMYMGVEGFMRAHAGFTNVVTNVLYVSVDEVVYGEELSENGRSRIV